MSTIPDANAAQTEGQEIVRDHVLAYYGAGPGECELEVTEPEVQGKSASAL